MSQDQDLEIYRQRYETFRYLDALHWRMLQIAVAAGSLTAIFYKDSNVLLDWWALLIVGLVLTVLGTTMIRIKIGVANNNKVLAEFGRKIGDDKIPKNRPSQTTISFWVAVIIIVIGFILIALAVKDILC